MSEFTMEDLRDLFERLARRMQAERDALCALDGEIGDGDHGIAMAQGMTAAAQAVRETPDGTMQDLFNAAAKGFLNAVGASSGPLYATGFLRAGKAAGPRPSLARTELAGIIPAIAEGIAHRGKASPGQKTMLDAWAPAAEASAAGGDAETIVAAARSGADATRDMLASLGRAARLGERARGHLDPGAASAVVVIEEICRTLD